MFPFSLCSDLLCFALESDLQEASSSSLALVAGKLIINYKCMLVLAVKLEFQLPATTISHHDHAQVMIECCSITSKIED